MTPDDPIVQFVAWCEGFRSAPYLDAGGIWTIGYGFTSVDGEAVGPKTRVMAEPEALALLCEELGQTERGIIADMADAGLNIRSWRSEPLASLVFNIGRQAWVESTIRKRMTQGRINDASAEFPKWVHVHGVLVKGLVWRRYWERQIFDNGYEAVQTLLESLHHAQPKPPPPTIVV